MRTNFSDMITKNMVKDERDLSYGLKKWWPDAESNCGHKDFQSSALPTELSGQH